MKWSMTSFAITILFLSVRVSVSEANAAQVPSQTRSQELLNGQRVYETQCAVCHGLDGNGRGPAAHMLLTQPRDFQPGLFKFRSTPSGALPTDDDLMKIVATGVRWTAMVGRADLTESQRREVIQYLKTFSPRFSAEKAPAAIVVPAEPTRSPKLLDQGRRVYRDAECAKCHGERGDGKGVASTELADEWGWQLPASDISWRPLKRGSARRDIYLTIATGLTGTSMPAYGAALDAQQIWALVNYLETLVPDAHKLAPREIIGEEQRGWMILRMHGTAGHGMRH